MNTKCIMIWRKGRQVVYSNYLALWRRQGGPAALAAAVASQKALIASLLPPEPPHRGVDPELLRLLNLMYPRA